LHVAEPSGRRPVTDPRHLPGLALAAVRGAPERPLLASCHGVATSPELRGDPGVVRVPVEVGELAVLDPVRDLATELEVPALVVDGPRRIRLHEDAVLRVADDVLQRTLAGLEVEVGQADLR